MRTNLILFIFLILSTQQSLCQQDSVLAKRYAMAIGHIEKKEFPEALESFKKVFSTKATLPDEVAYFYGYTLVNLGKYTQGRDALKKYVSLTSDTGRYVTYALNLINLADCKDQGFFYSKETCAECEGHGTVLIPCRTCQGHGLEACNLCGGSGVLKKKNDFGDTFNTCPKCHGKGDYECTVCHGTKKEKARCLVCDGKGKVRIRKDCDPLIMGLGKW